MIRKYFFFWRRMLSTGDQEHLCTENHREKCHSDLFRSQQLCLAISILYGTEATYKEPVSHLSEVSCPPRVEINLGVNLVNPRQRVHDDRTLLSLGQEIVIDDEHILDSFVLCQRGESFLLDPGRVQDIRFTNDLVEVVVLCPSDTGSGKVGLDRVWHREGCGRDKVQRDVVER